MRRWQKIAASVVAVLALLLVAAPFLIPLEAYRTQIEQLASRAAGRDVDIQGPLRLTFTPEFALSAHQVAVANVPGGRSPHLVTIDALIVGAKFWPLLKGRLEVTRIALEKPALFLEEGADGKGNWQSTGGDDGEGGFAVLRRLGIADIRISEGSARYASATGEVFAADGMELALALPAAGALTGAGEMRWRGEAFSLEAEITDPDALFSDGVSAAHIGIGSDLGGGRFAGRVNLKGRSDGTLRVSLPSLREAAAWAGVTLPPPETRGQIFDRGRPSDAFGEFDLEGGIVVGEKRIELTGLRASAGRSDLQGNVALDFTPEIPMLQGQVSLRRLNLDAYLGADANEAEAEAPDADVPASFRLGLLKEMNATLAINVRGLVAQKLVIDEAAIALTVKDGVLDASLDGLALYDGFGKGVVHIDARGTVPELRETLELTRVRMQNLLSDLMGVTRFDGDGALTLELNAKGNDEEALLKSLTGRASVSVTQGNVQGANLMMVARVVRGLITTETLASALGDQRGTEFSELAASFVVKDGVARTNDLSLSHPSFRLTGSGSVDLAERTMDLRLEPRAPANARLALPDLGIPFRVRGDWENLSYAPDLERLPAGVVRGLLEQPMKAITDPAGTLQSLFGTGR